MTPNLVILTTRREPFCKKKNTFLAPLAAKGLVRGDMENALESYVVGNISANSWRLHAPALLLLVLPQKSNMFPDLSASEKLWLLRRKKHVKMALIRNFCD